ncbi:5 -nucleotidase [Chlorella sorokiniana]|uniref:5-nucleotidase n=1 Tax=Chlorella sorokiniana TaxID=3076 RepID=A0A2P6U0L3_CHLSO|nr:5 -nucleotidase [Chlorella sorokiniana]|eukprot:PRW59853.1 5 -nucleotidase [Chlorella sorokiniana]
MRSSLAEALRGSTGEGLAGCRRPGGWAAPPPARRARLHHVIFSSAAANGSGSSEGQKRLTILHFNDVYNIESRPQEPVGGAARFMGAAREFAGEQPLVLFSGDCLNPSLMSAFTRGEQMVPVLNCIGVHAAAVGNHDFDFGIPQLQAHMQQFRFPWLLSNVLDARTGEPLGGCERSRIVTWQGVRVGLMGLVEREWLLTIPSIEADDIQFLDFCEEGRRLARELADQGAELIVALSHMRTPNDLVLAANVPEIQLILGGHDHHYEITRSEPHGTLVFKSGTDFREFSILRVGVPGSLEERPLVEHKRVEINSSVREDPEMAAIVRKYQDLIGTKMDEPLGWTHTDLDARFDTVRRSESNIGSMFADVMRISLGADIAFFNGGTIRSDQVHAAGQLITRDFVSMLPFTDELVLLELSGSDVLTALETGVGSWPALEGRFLQVSGLTFAFDSDQPPGSRVVRDSVRVAGHPLQLEARYKVATKAYLRGGKDGFESLKAAKVLVDGETNPRLATLVQYLWMRVEHLNEMLAEEWHRMLQREAAAQAAVAAEGAAELRHLAEERRAAAGGHANGSNGSSSSSGGSNGRSGHPEWLPQPAPVGSTGSMASMASTASVSSIDHYWEHHDAQQAQQAQQAVGGGSSSATAVYAPSAPSYGTAVGGPGSIPHASEEHLLEVSTTGAAISLALLLQQRSEAEEASRSASLNSSSSATLASSDAAGSQDAPGNGAAAAAASSSSSPQGQWVPTNGQAAEETARHSTAALSALAWLDPCTHGLDELIIFDAIRRKFGIGPRVEGRIRRLQSGQPAQLHNTQPAAQPLVLSRQEITLELCWAPLELCERHRTVPFVCRAWRHQLNNSPQLLQNITACFPGQLPAARFRSFYEWMLRWGTRHTQTLDLDVVQDGIEDELDSQELGQILTALLCACGAAGQLRQLLLYHNSIAESTCWLATMRQLRVLHVEVLAMDDVDAVLDFDPPQWSLASLEQLWLSASRLRVEPTAHLPVSLTTMHLERLQGTSLPSQFLALSRLQELSLNMLDVTSAGYSVLTSLSSLRRLVLGSTPVLPACLPQLTWLEALVVADVDSAIEHGSRQEAGKVLQAAVPALAGQLTCLALPDTLVGSIAPPALLTACSGLQALFVLAGSSRKIEVLPPGPALPSLRYLTGPLSLLASSLEVLHAATRLEFVGAVCFADDFPSLCRLLAWAARHPTLRHVALIGRQDELNRRSHHISDARRSNATIRITMHFQPHVTRDQWQLLDESGFDAFYNYIGY